MLLHHTACSAHQRKGNYWYMLPEYAQARKSMWDAINPHTGKKRLDESFPPEIRKSTNAQEMKLELHCGSTLQLVGSDNYNSLVGSPPVGLVFSEYALSDPSAWSYLMPILEENGGWAAFNSTPRGSNHFKNLCKFAESEPGWFLDVKTADETKVYKPEQLQSILRTLQAEHGNEYGKSLWLQEYYVSFDAAIPGSIFGEWMDRIQTQGQILEFDVAAGINVNTAWDLGRTDSTAIWFFQVIQNEIRIIDYHESSLKDIEFYANLLRQKSAEFDCPYGTHYLPHDARARTLAAGGKSIQQQMMDQQVGRIQIAKRLDHNDGIQAARKTLPWCWFRESATERGREVLRNYHYEWDEDKKCFANMPAHDWASHGASAFRTLALSWKIPSGPKPEISIEKQLLAQNPATMTFGKLKNDFLRKMKRLREERL